MTFTAERLFDPLFLGCLRKWIATHHTVYPNVPPQGIYFESLVERAFLDSGWQREQVVLENPNSPKADIRIGSVRLSLKTETGKGTKPDSISITKLCTTETGEWSSRALISHAMSHLSRYEGILMLRCIWDVASIRYQVINVPISVLKLMSQFEAGPVGTRPGRKSMGFDVIEGGTTMFRVHFDGADGKCQIHRLRRDRCLTLAEWTGVLDTGH